MLLFIDNIFRFTWAGSEVSALLGRIPSAVGYQPTLATDMGTMQERIAITKKRSITSVQVKAMQTIFQNPELEAELSSFLIMSFQAIWPDCPRPRHCFYSLGRDHCLVPWRRRVWNLPRCRPPRLHLPYRGPQHHGVACDPQKLLQDYKSLEEIIAILCMD